MYHSGCAALSITEVSEVFNWTFTIDHLGASHCNYQILFPGGFKCHSGTCVWATIQEIATSMPMCVEFQCSKLLLRMLTSSYYSMQSYNLNSEYIPTVTNFCVNFSELLLFSAEDNSSTAFRTKFLRSTRQVLPKKSGQTVKKWLCWSRFTKSGAQNFM